MTDVHTNRQAQEYMTLSISYDFLSFFTNSPSFPHMVKGVGNPLLSNDNSSMPLIWQNNQTLPKILNICYETRRNMYKVILNEENFTYENGVKKTHLVKIVETFALHMPPHLICFHSYQKNPPWVQKTQAQAVLRSNHNWCDYYYQMDTA